MKTHASGPFDVKLNPQSSEEDADGTGLGRLSIDKQFHGDLEATSKGEMLQGRTGTFILQHSGTMTRGAPQLAISVVPDSGTGGLEEISGTMTINIVNGKHFYEFDYVLPAAR